MTLGVVQELRGLGIGKALINMLDGIVELHVVDYNHKAIGFYLKNGFEFQKKIPDYYEIFNKRYDALFFKKN